MGLSYRKSIKIGKNTRVNLSKTGGIGISTGVKGARISVNRRGMRTQVGAKGVYYRKDYSFKNNNNEINSGNGNDYNSSINNYIVGNENAIESIQLDKLNKAIKQYRILIASTWICIILGFFKPIFLVISFCLLGFVFCSKNNKRNWMLNNVVYYYKKGKNSKARESLNKAKTIFEDDITEELNKLFTPRYTHYSTEKTLSVDNNKDTSDLNIRENNSNETNVKNEEQTQFSKQVARNLKGKEFEKNEDIESAIALYELNIKDGFEGTHPYDRLAILYRKQKRYDDEIRVLNRALEVFNNLYLNCDIEPRKDGFNKTVEKYKYRLNRANELKANSKVIS